MNDALRSGSGLASGTMQVVINCDNKKKGHHPLVRVRRAKGRVAIGGDRKL
jgi:hypothetical protein